VPEPHKDKLPELIFSGKNPPNPVGRDNRAPNCEKEGRFAADGRTSALTGGTRKPSAWTTIRPQPANREVEGNKAPQEGG